MAIEEGIVTKLGSTTAWVTIKKPTGCSPRHATAHRHTTRVRNNIEIEGINAAGADVGDRVLIRVNTSELLQQTSALYGFPLFCTILGIITGLSIGSAFNYNVIVSSAVSGFLFFSLAFLYTKLTERKKMQRDENKSQIIKIIQRK